MHELSIAMSIIDLATEEGQRHQSRVLAVHVRVGPLSGVVPAALESAFALAREGTQLAECELVVETPPIVLYCPRCGENRPAQSVQSLRCGECGEPGTRIVSGRELEFAALELEA